MRTGLTQLLARVSGFAVAAAIVGAALTAAPVSAQVCAYNSTQATCACPTSGGGTTCFGGQLYKAADSSCQNDGRSCASNQQWNCSTEACECNTSSYPCGGCTAASSTVGATCSAPTNGKYTNVCGACACPAGTTLCGSSNTCVTNLSCPAGTTFDPCTNTCGTPYVLLNPTSTQSGAIKVDGNITSTAGNEFLQNGDLYLGNSKAIRVDGTGVTTLNIGNWGGGGTGVNVNLPTGSQFCFNATCRASWPSTTDFDPTYLNANGDTMTGTLNITGASSDLYVADQIGIGTTSPASGYKLDVNGLIKGSGIVISGTTANSVTSTQGQTLYVHDTATSNTGGWAINATSDNQAGIVGVSPVYGVQGAGQGSGTGVMGVIGSGVSGDAVRAESQSDAGRALFVNTNGIDTRKAVWAPNGINYFGYRIGIGTTNPVASLDIRSTATYPLLVYSTGTATGSWFQTSTAGTNDLNTGVYITRDTTGTAAAGLGSGVAFGLKDASGSMYGSTGGIYNFWTDPAAATRTSAMSFYTMYNNAGASEKMRLTGDGKLGIGTTAPGATLDVNGTAKMTGFQLPSGAGAGKLLTSDASGNGTWQVFAAPVSSVSGSGAGISVSPTTGAVVVSNTGVTSLSNGTDNVVTASTGSVAVNNTSTLNSVTTRGASTGNAINVGSNTTSYGISAQGTTGAVAGQTWSNFAIAGDFNALNGGANSTGVRGSGSYTGVFGASAAGGNAGVSGQGGYYGGYFTGNQYGAYSACSPSGCTGQYGSGTSYGVYGTGTASNGIGVYGTGLTGLYGVANGSGIGYGVFGTSPTSYGVYGYTGTSAYGVYGAGPSAISGVYGTSNTGYGVQGYGPSSAGGQFSGSTGINVSGSSWGVYSSGGTNYFAGSVGVGTTSPASKLSVTGDLRVDAGGAYPGGGTIYGSAGSWGPSLGVDNGSQAWRTVSWSDNSYKIVKFTGTTFTPLTIYNDSYQDELELKSNGISLSGKHAFRSSDSWLRLNQDGAFTSGVHTPGNFAPGALNVGGANGWGNPGGGNAWILGTETVYGDISAESNSWGSGSGWVYCAANGQCWCPGGSYVIAELNYNYYYGYNYIYCAKP